MQTNKIIKQGALRFQRSIDKQIKFNQGKNFFARNTIHSLKFIQETIQIIEEIDELDKDSENILIDYAVDKSLQEFCRINQYYAFSKQAKKDLRDIYADLFYTIRNRKCSGNTIAEIHYRNLKQWLIKTNPFAEKLYTSEKQILVPVTCSEYSSCLQMDILKIDLTQIKEPVLDIGCGKEGNLVMYLRKNGIEAYGIDRFANNIPDLINADWLEFEYGIEKWGTITSHLGFSNHFKHHHFREDGNFIEYARKYMDIIKSLKQGGCFHYTPDLPFIEQYLDVTKYQLMRQYIGEHDFTSIIVKRL